MTEFSWIVKLHPDFFHDLDKLGSRELDNFYQKKKKISRNPLRQKHLSGGANCYREPITDNVRLIYYIEKNSIWLLTIGTHKKVYDKFLKRLYSLRKSVE